jgi:tetrahydromethanopterin S-methyltransferase subunit A
MDSEPLSGTGSRLSEWPPVEGRYTVGNRESPVAVCTMSSVDMRFPMERIAIAGKCVTENLGIEKMVKNIVSNPNIRCLIVCGRESMGHFVDDALECLVRNGVDDEGRIINAKGGIPVLKNLNREEVERFRKQVEIVNMAGETEVDRIMERVNEYSEGGSGPFSGEAVVSSEPARVAAPTHPVTDWNQDPRGYFTIQVSPERHEIVVEHHGNSGRILNVVTGRNAEDLYHHIINTMGIVSRLDHAAYLGRELAKAETALFNGMDYEQDTGLVLPEKSGQPPGQSPETPVDTDGKEMVPLPTHGKLVSVKKIEKTREVVLTYVVNDREFPVRSPVRDEEERFREFLRTHGMFRAF